MTNNLNVRAIGIHTYGKAGSPNMSIIGDSASIAEVIGRPLRASPLTIGATHVEGLAGFVGKNGAAVSIVKIELPVWACDEGMQTVIVIDRVEPC